MKVAQIKLSLVKVDQINFCQMRVNMQLLKTNDGDKKQDIDK